MITETHKLLPHRFKGLNNYVLVRPDRNENHLKDDKIYSIDTSYEKEKHAPRTGTVISVPDSLYYNHNEDDNFSMPWDTEMELEAGDDVTYHFLSALTAEEKGFERVMYHNDVPYYWIKYDRIFTAKRQINKWDESIIMLNGFVLVEPVKDKELERYKSILEIPKKMDTYYGIICHIGSLNKAYRHTHEQFYGGDQDNVKVGDLVLMNKVCDIPLEYPLHAKLNSGEIFYRVQRRYLFGKYS